MTSQRLCRGDREVSGRMTDDGFMLVEMLVAISLGAVFIVIMASASRDARSVYARAVERQRLLDIAESVLGSSHDLSPGQARTDVIHGIYIEAKLYGNDRYEIDTTIVSTSTNDKPVSVSFAEIRALPRDSRVPIGHAICAAVTTDHSQVFAIGLPIPARIPLVDIEVRDDIAYIAANSAVASDPDIYVVDIQDRTRPRILSSIDTGPGIASIALAGERLYAAADSTVAQLHIIRIAGLGSLVVESKYRLQLPYATSTPPHGTAIAYEHGLVYLGTDKWDGREVSIIDVADSTAPYEVSGIEVDSKIGDITTHGSMAYIAASGADQMLIVDASVPTAPVVQRVSLSGWQRQVGTATSLFEGELVLGRNSGGYDIATDHEIFWWQDVGHGLFRPSSQNMPGGAYSIVPTRSNLYVATRGSLPGIVLFDTRLTTTSQQTVHLPVAPEMMSCDNSNLYILGHGSPVIYEINY